MPKKVFAKGVSGNAGGRPKGYKPFREWCQQQVEQGGHEQILKIAKGATMFVGRDGMAVPDHRTQLMAWRFITEYAYGQPKQSLDVTLTQSRVVLEYPDGRRESLETVPEASGSDGRPGALH